MIDMQGDSANRRATALVETVETRCAGRDEHEQVHERGVGRNACRYLRVSCIDAVSAVLPSEHFVHRRQNLGSWMPAQSDRAAARTTAMPEIDRPIAKAFRRWACLRLLSPVLHFFFTLLSSFAHYPPSPSHCL